MNDNKEQITRIREMERRFNRAIAVVKRLTVALDKWETAQKDIAALNAYYVSGEWRKDFDDDEAGLLPADLKRGVLSEDGLWNLLEDCKELSQRLQEMSNQE